ncbi:MAG: Kdo2-lipid lauroyltransferase/acyltransferase [Thauera sp.]|nr:Kdo2-lipid lauroyltransferase/acyltransferase [Thauera sp.]
MRYCAGHPILVVRLRRPRSLLDFLSPDSDVLVDLSFRLLSRLPLSCLHRLGSWAGWLVYRASPSYARRLRENLFNALGREDEGVLRAAIAEAGRQALELPWIWLRPAEEVVAAAVRTEGWELVEQARADGAGILFITPHLGCFEITAQCIAAKIPITVLYRPPRKPELQPLMEAGRARGQMRTAPADLSGVRKLVKTLRSQEAVGMLPDQVPGEGEGMWVPFFGKPAWTMTLAARLAAVKGVRVIYTWAERLPRGEGYVFRLQAPTEALTSELEADVAIINREVERIILQCPQQYLWGYNRYKQPRGERAAAADSGEAGQ